MAHNLGGKVVKQARKPRRPQHRAMISAMPWELNVVACAPVLPGETLKNLLLQARVVSDPVKSSIVGAWLEYYVFYVKCRQTDLRDTFTAAVLDATDTLAASSADAATYYNADGVDWVKACRDVIVREWFRDEGTDEGDYLGRGNRPLVRVGIDSWLDSVVDTTVLSDGGALGASQEAQDKAQELYEYMRTMRFTQMSFEDWVASFGVNLPKVADRDRPELLRYTREWTYPTNTVEPTTGVPSACWSWGVAERADKDRFFPEPGFIVVLQAVRPKVYYSNQAAAGSVMLDRVMRWMPAIMADDPSTSLAEFTNSNGPLINSTNGYWVDVRDLLIHGDQFIDYGTDPRGADQANLVALPTADLETKFVTSLQEARDLFANGGDGDPEGNCFIRSDISVALNILGTQQDYT